MYNYHLYPMRDFYLVYQPKVCNKKIVGLETLIRPKCKEINVSQYLDLKVNKVELDLAVIRECLKEIVENHIEVPVSINIYPSSLDSEFFVHTVAKLLKNKNIILELVEHEKSSFTPEFIRNVNFLKNEKILISVDDFGKDFARADLALDLQVDQVKFDKSLIDGIENNYFKYKHLAFLYTKISSLCTTNIVFEGVEKKFNLN